MRVRKSSRLLFGTLTTALLVTACGNSEPAGAPAPPPAPALAGGVGDFADCDALVARLRTGVLAHATADGLNPFAVPVEGFDINADTYASPGPTDSGTDPVGGTTVTEPGVDEPGSAKLAGDLIVAVRGRTLETYDVRQSAPVALGKLNLQKQGMDAQTVLVAGTRALVSGYAMPQSGYGLGGPDPDRTLWRAPRQHLVMLALVDLADPARPRLISTQTVQAGGVNLLRLTGSTARLVTSRFPDLALRTPKASKNGRDAGAAAANVDTVRQAPVTSWLGRRTVVDAATGLPVVDSRVAECTAVRDIADAGPAITTVQTIDLTREDALQAAESIAFVGGSEAYVSPNRVYLANPPNSKRPTTVLQALDAGPDPRSKAGAATAVDGHLRQAGAMSERAGNLRVLLNDRPTPVIPSDGTQRDTRGVARIEVLDGDLKRVGGVSDVAGGSAAARVRWLGDLAAVGTDHQFRPLHLVDLTDPRRPVVSGLLNTEGRYTYLHPVDDHTILGLGTSEHDIVGEDATVPFQGLAVSSLDVTDTRAPSRPDRIDLGLGHADIGYLGHTFMYSAERRTATFSAYLDTGNTCLGDEYCLSGGDVVPDKCRADVNGCREFSDGAEIPGLTAVRIGTDGSLTQTGRWTGGEIADILALPDRLVILTWESIVVVDPVTLQLIATTPLSDPAPAA